MLKTTILSQVLATNEVLGAMVLAANEVGDIEDDDRSNNKSKRIKPKPEKSAKSGNSKGKKLAKSKKPLKSGNSPNFGATKPGPSFLTPEARSAFNCLRLAFTEAPIFQHFDPECHIRIETDALGYAIGSVLSQLAFGTSSDGVVTKTDLGQWHSVAFFSRKMILIETRYETHNGEFLVIVKAFKTWRHYLEGCNHKFSPLRSTITSVVSWIRRTWALDKSARPKSSLNTISKSTIARVRQIWLQMFCWGFPREARMRKKSSELRMAKSFIVCKIH